MTGCILKSCPHDGPGRCKTLGTCGAAFALDLAGQRDGYLVIARDNLTIDALRKAGLVTTQSAGDGCLIVKAVHTPQVQPREAGRWARALKIGPVTA